MRLTSPVSELSAIRTITNRGRYGAMLLGVLSKQHFHNALLRESFERVSNLASRSEIPDLLSLSADPVLSQEARVLLRTKVKAAKPVKKMSGYKGLRSTLDKYRKMRSLAMISQRTLEALDSDSVDLEQLLDHMSNELARARSAVELDQQLFHIGSQGNLHKSVKKLLKGKVQNFIPTGVTEFDQQNSGLREGSLVILSANTGGLKSTVAKELANNIYTHAHRDVAYVSLEMDLEETVFRLFSSRTGIAQSRFLKGILSKKEKEQAWEEFLKMQKQGEKHGCRFTILPATEESLGIDATLATLRPYRHKVVFIDYITLLSDSDDNEQWKALGYIARKAKMYAKKNKCVVVLLTQLSEDDRIRYSRTILEHADLWWYWRITDKERQSGRFTVNIGKARNQSVFPFELAVDFPTNRVFNPVDSLRSNKESGKRGKGMSKSESFRTSSKREDTYFDEVKTNEIDSREL